MLTALTLVTRGIRVLSAVGGWCAGILIMATTALILTEIGYRVFLGRSTRLAEEYSGYFLAAMILVGAAYALANGEHIRIMILRERLSAEKQLWLDRFALAVGTAITGVLLWALFDLFYESLSYGVRSLHPSRTPMAVPHGAVLAGAALLFLQFLALLLETWLPKREQAEE